MYVVQTRIEGQLVDAARRGRKKRNARARVALDAIRTVVELEGDRVG